MTIQLEHNNSKSLKNSNLVLKFLPLELNDQKIISTQDNPNHP